MIFFFRVFFGVGFLRPNEARRNDLFFFNSLQGENGQFSLIVHIGIFKQFLAKKSTPFSRTGEKKDDFVDF